MAAGFIYLKCFWPFYFVLGMFSLYSGDFVVDLLVLFALLHGYYKMYKVPMLDSPHWIKYPFWTLDTG